MMLHLIIPIVRRVWELNDIGKWAEEKGKRVISETCSKLVVSLTFYKIHLLSPAVPGSLNTGSASNG